MKNLIPALFLFLALSSYSQSPQGIPYQAVMRNVDGTEMANSAVSLTFMIHDGTAGGTIVYQENHALTSNAQGLVSCVVGNGVVSQGNFASINWGSGAKFLHVMMGSVDLGTQQMLSVPYALYAESTHLSVSPTGDTLSIGGQSVIVPGISSANPANNIPTSGLGAQVLPGNATCANEYINVVGCNGQTSLTYDGRTYDLVEIGGQCWFADNLATDQYRNGDLIPTGLDNTTWQNTTTGAFAIYNNDPVNDSIYGKLYNWYTTVDSRGLCPSGWHVPSDCEWMYLEGSLGMSLFDQEVYGNRGTNEGGAMKSITGWNSPNIGATNQSELSILSGGSREYNSVYVNKGVYGALWTSTPKLMGLSGYPTLYSFCRILGYNFSNVYRGEFQIRMGYSVRCLKDSQTLTGAGCTDGAACNFLANANQDDGSCLYLNATCDDGNANTINDVINNNCQCAGEAIVNGCTDAQACNYNAAANVDDGSCLIQGTACNDNNSNTTNDVINGSCVCTGTAVNNNNVVIGQDYQGGKVAYIFQPGDAGYVAGEKHGLIAAAQDLQGTYQWGCYGMAISGADGLSIGSGAQNTIDIVNAGCMNAAEACSNLIIENYDDWFLPSMDELQKLYDKRLLIGGFQSSEYWSSSEHDANLAYLWDFFYGYFVINAWPKSNNLLVRPIRTF